MNQIKLIEKDYQLTSISINLLNMADALNNPSLKALLRDGWEVFSFIPVEDEGKPKLIIFLKQPLIYKNKTNYSLYLKIISIILAFQMFMILWGLWILMNS